MKKHKNGPSRLVALDNELAQSEILCDELTSLQERFEKLTKAQKGAYTAKLSTQMVAVKSDKKDG